MQISQPVPAISALLSSPLPTALSFRGSNLPLLTVCPQDTPLTQYCPHSGIFCSLVPLLTVPLPSSDTFLDMPFGLLQHKSAASLVNSGLTETEQIKGDVDFIVGLKDLGGLFQPT